MYSKLPSGGGVTPLVQPVLPRDEMTPGCKWNSTPSSAGSSTRPGVLVSAGELCRGRRELGWRASLGPGHHRPRPTGLGSKSANVALCARGRCWRHPGCRVASQQRGGRGPEQVDAVSRSELIAAAHIVTDGGLVPDGWPWSRMA